MSGSNSDNNAVVIHASAKQAPTRNNIYIYI